MTLTTDERSFAKWNVGITVIALTIFWLIFALMSTPNLGAAAATTTLVILIMIAVTFAIKNEVTTQFAIAGTGGTAATIALVIASASALPLKLLAIFFVPVIAVAACAATVVGVLTFSLAYGPGHDVMKEPDVDHEFAFYTLLAEAVVIFCGMAPAFFL